MPPIFADPTPGDTSLHLDAPANAKVALVVAQVVTAAGGLVKSPDGGCFDMSGFQQIEFHCVLYSVSGSPTSVTIVARENDANLATGLAAAVGGQVAFTSAASEIAAGRAKQFTVRWRGKKKFAGVSVLVTGGTSVGVAILARATGALDTVEAQAPGTLATAATLA